MSLAHRQAQLANGVDAMCDLPVVHSGASCSLSNLGASHSLTGLCDAGLESQSPPMLFQNASVQSCILLRVISKQTRGKV